MLVAVLQITKLGAWPFFGHGYFHPHARLHTPAPACVLVRHFHPHVHACTHTRGRCVRYFHPHARTRGTCRLVPCFSSSVEPCGYVGRFAALPSSSRSRVRPPHSPCPRSFASFWASSSETHTDSRWKPAFFMRRLCRARSSALPLRAVFACCSGVM